MTRLSEKRDVQDALVNYLIGIGWEYLPPDEIMNMRNGDEREPFLLPIARGQLIALNPSTSLRAGPGRGETFAAHSFSRAMVRWMAARRSPSGSCMAWATRLLYQRVTRRA